MHHLLMRAAGHAATLETRLTVWTLLGLLLRCNCSSVILQMERRCSSQEPWVALQWLLCGQVAEDDVDRRGGRPRGMQSNHDLPACASRSDRDVPLTRGGPEDLHRLRRAPQGAGQPAAEEGRAEGRFQVAAPGRAAACPTPLARSE